MKIRIVSSIALTAAIALGATGCGLIAPVGTAEPYAPSDGIDVSVDGADVRNLMLVADQTQEHFNVVFTAVNNSDQIVNVMIDFATETSSASAQFELTPGSNKFGDPEGERTPVLVPLSGVQPGDTVKAYVQSSTGGNSEREIPVLDGTLAEYASYVLPEGYSTHERNEKVTPLPLEPVETPDNDE